MEICCYKLHVHGYFSAGGNEVHGTSLRRGVAGWTRPCLLHGRTIHSAMACPWWYWGGEIPTMSHNPVSRAYIARYFFYLRGAGTTISTSAGPMERGVWVHEAHSPIIGKFEKLGPLGDFQRPKQWSIKKVMQKHAVSCHACSYYELSKQIEPPKVAGQSCLNLLQQEAFSWAVYTIGGLDYWTHLFT